MAESYDLVIVGAGVTGLATAMYAARLGLKNLVLGATSGTERPIGGVITTTEIVENYPGFIRLTGLELAKKLEDHARSYKEVTIREEKAEEILKNKKCFVVRTNKAEYESKTVIYATGAKWKMLPMKGAEEFKNRGVHYCALCDGALYKNKVVAIVGGGDTAAKDALLLAELCEKVYVVVRGEKMKPEPVNAKRVEANKKIEVLTKTNIVEIKGDKFVNKIKLDKAYKGKKEIEVSAVFGAIGTVPISDLAKRLGVKTDEKGQIIIDRDSRTNVPGFFAAGDVVDTSFKQAITGVAEGVTAAHSAYEYINKESVCVSGDY